jgi:alpha-glucuronidase
MTVHYNMKITRSLIPRFIAVAFALQAGIHAKDAPVSSPLWLNYQALAPDLQKQWSVVVQHVHAPGSSDILQNARNELIAASTKLTNRKVGSTEAIDQDGTVLLGTLAQLRDLLPATLEAKAEALKDGGFRLESAIVRGKKCTVIVSKDEAGVLYGTFHLIRLMQTAVPAAPLSHASEPAIELRMLNHWDNMSGDIERGYGGNSLWKWDQLPGHVNQQCHDYARFCASIGINGVVLNNVNADPKILRQDYLMKVAALAEVFRTWGIRTYLSVNFCSPIHPTGAPGKPKRWRGVGNLDTADPADPAVRAWWTQKAAEIHALIPDFGGFLVKADSEGMPGPQHYKRTHLDGANMLADALAPIGGTLIWRAFVYGRSDDRAMDACHEFKPLDGKFRDNVFLQVKNGPLDFQPREPFTPLFGAMPDTDLALELQIAKEYLGHATTLAYLGPMWTEILGSDTHAKGSGSTIAKVIDGSLHGRKKTCIAGVANTGDGDEWCGSIFNQANWYAYGRLAWNPRLGAEEIAEEWIRMTFQCDAPTRAAILKMMMRSYEAIVDYSMPMGLNLLCAYDGHYSPSPETRMSFHKADAKGLGFDRTRQGSNYVGQYHSELQANFNDRDKTPLEYLLWFHHVPWDAKLSSGRTLWEELTFRYNRGVEKVDQMAETWQSLEGKVAQDIHASVMKKLLEEKDYARLWRDECVRYFSGFARRGEDHGEK